MKSSTLAAIWSLAATVTLFVSAFYLGACTRHGAPWTDPIGMTHVIVSFVIQCVSTALAIWFYVRCSFLAEAEAIEDAAIRRSQRYRRTS